MKKTIILILITLLFTPSITLAKRKPPKELNPVRRGGIKYSIHHGELLKKKTTDGAYIRAYDIALSEPLWDLKIYSIEYDEEMEKDVQDVFVRSFKLKKDKFIIRNERNDMFIVNIRTKKVKPKDKVYSFK
jgi:hypothetical protein